MENAMAGDVRSIMTREVVTAAPQDSVTDVARLLSTHAISAVPVCDAGGKLVGIISEGDLLRPFGRQHNLRRDWWLALLAEGSDLAPQFLDYIRKDREPVSALMTKAVVTTVEATTLAEVADLLTQHGIKRLPVLRDGRVVGIVSRADLIRAFLVAPAPRGTLSGVKA